MGKLRILHLEDNPADAVFVEHELEKGGFNPEMVRVHSEAEFSTAIERRRPEVILVDNGVPGFDGKAALKLARERCPETPFIFVSGKTEENVVRDRLEAGATDYVSKDHLWQLTSAIRRTRPGASAPGGTGLWPQDRHLGAMKRLVQAVQDLSMSRSLDDVIAVVRSAARELTGSDGATFVLRDGDQCHYADEDAIAPLWKGQRFPMSACISGWVMLNRRPATIEDIYEDERIPADAYRPTFVKSLVMVPIRSDSPIGAIGNYWAEPHQATSEEVDLLQALANTTSVAMENIQLYTDLERRIRERTSELEMANRELESFSYSVSHDLRAPLRAINGFIGLLAERSGSSLDPESWNYITLARSGAARMAMLIDDLLRLARISRGELKRQTVDLGAMARETLAGLQSQHSDRAAEWWIQEDLSTTGDSRLLGVVLENLLSNAWKFSSKQDKTRIWFGRLPEEPGFDRFYVRDNGAGFDMKYAENLFAPFRRLHREDEFGGTGIGLATVRRIIERHGGTIWAEAGVGTGATFFFSLPTGND